MEQDRLVECARHLEHPVEARVRKRDAVDVGVELQAVGAVLEGALGFLRRRVRRVHGQRRQIPGEAVGIARAQLGQPVIAEPRIFGRLFGPGEDVEGGSPSDRICR